MTRTIDIVIVDAIKMIVEASDGKVNYDVDSFVDWLKEFKEERK